MTTIGMIGLGIMGRPIAENLLHAGYPLVVHNRSRDVVDALVAEGAAGATSPAEVAAAVDIVVTMLPDAPDVELVMRGPLGVAEGIRSGAVIVDMTTSTPALARDLAKFFGSRSVAVLDAPVSGGETGAIEGELSIMVGGSQSAFDMVLPVLQVVGKTVVRIGEAGAGQVTKAANQMVVAITLAAVAEALLLAERAGATPALVREALLGGFAQSRVLEVHGDRMLRRDFRPGFRSVLHRKDLRIALQTAEACGLAVPTTALAHQLFNGLVGRGLGDSDHAAVVIVLEGMSDVVEA